MGYVSLNLMINLTVLFLKNPSCDVMDTPISFKSS
ncbi:hypothetical protein [Plasmodium yoelii yoelii]|uniref:Uncharacterized protein n=1 Tax=Plasmodium yoelii yoelii TaxID=73239 RepID=Q7RF92_PLAYO|nr:hypothetical protein [Plasmodium yoelii yoelii]